MTIADSRVVERNDGVAGVDRMWDSQWVNVVNKAKSIEEAAKLTEQYMAANHKSLLAEAESRAQYWKGERQAGNAVINDLRARLDAVLSVVTALERVPRGKYPRAAKIIVDLRSAALGGESPGNDEELK